ncbi:MAG: hypothetical protein JNL26_11960 [Gemmatimonadetes bacterium]|nr:hypothetical protein [Gemmatimonadota bacterium]
MTPPLAFDEPEFLTLRVGGSPTTVERLMLIGRPRQGTVRVRQWTSNSWNTEGEVFEVAAATLLADIQRVYDAREQVSEEMYGIRRWLTG